MHAVDEYLQSEGRDIAWELFHENSKTSRAEPQIYFGHHPSDATVVRMMRGLRDVKPYADRPKCALPPEPSNSPELDQVLLGRISARAFAPASIDAGDLGGILRRMSSVTRDNAGTDYPRPFRSAPAELFARPIWTTWARWTWSMLSSNRTWSGRPLRPS